MKSKELKIYNIPRDKPPLLVLTVKPRQLLFVILLMSIALFCLNHAYSMISLVAGAICLFALVAMPDRTLLEVYESMLIIYDSRRMDSCHCIYWEEILHWQYIREQHKDCLRIELIDGRCIECDCFRNNKLIFYLNFFAQNKEKKIVRRRGKI